MGGKESGSLRIINLIQSEIFPCRYVRTFGIVIRQLVGNFNAHRVISGYFYNHLAMMEREFM